MVFMENQSKKTDQDKTRLSKARIIETAIQILDADGEDALTFRALTARLSTGNGAIYWYVANKTELLAEAAGEVIAQTMARTPRSTEPKSALRALALGVFDTIETHPWVGAQLSRGPWQAAAVQIFERVGEQLQPLGVPPESQFNCAAALMNYIFGLAGQYAAVAGLHRPTTNRADFLKDVTTQWMKFDAAAYPFIDRIAAQMQEHDEREQFLVGINLFLIGVETVFSPGGSSKLLL